MNFSHSINLASAVATLVCSLALGQQATERETGQQTGQQRKTAQTEAGTDPLVTQYLAGTLMLMNHCTIQMSDMAEQRSESKEVKQFAQMLSQHHQQLNEELRRLAPEVADLTMLKEGEQRTAAFRGKQTSGDSDPQHSGDAALVTRLLEIDRQATQNYLKSSTQMLQQYEGQDFDMGFLGFQIGAHTWAQAELQACEGTGDDEFQQVIKRATENVEQHLQQARQLAKQFEDDRRQ